MNRPIEEEKKRRAKKKNKDDIYTSGLFIHGKNVRNNTKYSEDEKGSQFW